MFKISIPQIDNADNLQIEFQIGRITFLLGANGTGKSSLMDEIASKNPNNIYRVYAYRDITLSSNSASMTGQHVKVYRDDMKRKMLDIESRYYNNNMSQNTQLTLYDLSAKNQKFYFDLQNSIRMLDGSSGDLAEGFRKLQLQKSPIERIESAMLAAGIKTKISLSEDGSLKVARLNAPEYGIQELSDGERSAFLLGASVINAPAASLILIDEPERHLHKSISSPLISYLIAERQDCAFVISTHDIGLPLDQPDCSALLMREYTHSPRSWKLDYVERVESLDGDIVEAILGSRRKIIFVEGSRTSLDQSLYSILFPEYSVKAVSSCSDVIDSTKAVNATAGDHWLTAVGIIDRDRRSDDNINKLQGESIYTLSVQSIENIYYFPSVVESICDQLSSVGLLNSDEIKPKISDVIIGSIKSSSDFLANDATERRVRISIMSDLPTSKELAKGKFRAIGISSRSLKKLCDEELSALNKLLESGDAASIMRLYSVKKTPAPKAIRTLLGVSTDSAYASMVRRLAGESAEFADLLRGFIGPLSSVLATQAGPVIDQSAAHG